MSWAKYKNSKVEMSERSFASKLEASVFQMLKLQERAGEIKEIQTQVQVHLTKARILYKPDFKFYDLRVQEYKFAEAKGMATAVWAIKKRLWEYYGEGDLLIYTGHHSRPSLSEIVKVKGDT